MVERTAKKEWNRMNKLNKCNERRNQSMKKGIKTNIPYQLTYPRITTKTNGIEKKDQRHIPLFTNMAPIPNPIK